MFDDGGILVDRLDFSDRDGSTEDFGGPCGKGFRVGAGDGDDAGLSAVAVDEESSNGGMLGVRVFETFGGNVFALGQLLRYLKKDLWSVL